MTDKELIWIATVFDCEGNIALIKSQYVKKNGEISYYENPIVQMGHCSLDLITRFHTLVGKGQLYGHNYNYKYIYGEEAKKVYWWKITKRADVLWFIALIWNEWLSDYRRETIRNLKLIE